VVLPISETWIACDSAASRLPSVTTSSLVAVARKFDRSATVASGLLAGSWGGASRPSRMVQSEASGTA
jgi:hypothetical protein